MKQLNDLRTEYARAMRVGFFLAVRQIRRSSKGTTVLIISIMILTFLNLVVVSGLLTGLITGSFAQFRSSYAGDVIITAPERQDHIEDSQEIIAFLNQQSRVDSFSPRYLVGATVLGTLDRLPAKGEEANQTGLSLAGIDPIREEAVTEFSHFILEGEALEAGDTGYILIGSNLLKKYSSFADADIPGLTLLENVDVGSRVRVSIGQRDGGAATKEFIVKGIVKSKVDQISTRAFVLDEEVKRLLAVNQLEVQEIAIKTDPAYAATLAEELRLFIGDRSARVQTYDQAIPQFLRDIESTMAVLGNALSSIALVVATITVFIVIFINAVTKRKFIGIMKGVGISPAAIEFSYVLQAFFYGTIGSAVGTLLTFGFLVPFFAKHPIDFPFSDGILVATPEGAAIRVAILMTVTVIAGYVPAKMIVRKNTLDAILGR